MVTSGPEGFAGWIELRWDNPTDSILSTTMGGWVWSWTALGDLPLILSSTLHWFYRYTLYIIHTWVQLDLILLCLLRRREPPKQQGVDIYLKWQKKRNCFKKKSYEIFIHFVEMFQGCVCKLCVTKCHRICPMSGTKHTLIEISPTEKEGEREIECYPQNIFSGWWLSKDLMKCHKKGGFPISSSIRTNCVWKGIYKLRDNQPFRSGSWCSPAPRSNYQSFL